MPSTNQRRSWSWYKLNGLLRIALAHSATNYFPLYIVNEYPKSGASWIGEMLSDALGIPFPRNRLPMLRSSILHAHMMSNWNVHNILLVWRDGRDVLISQYFHYLFENDKGNQNLVSRYRSILQFDDYDDVQKNLPAFMEYVYEDKGHLGFTWACFVEQWANHNQYKYIKYEDMRTNPEDELTRIVQQMANVKLGTERIRSIVDKHSFQNISGRKAGEENTRSFLRKGIVGDWKNYFGTDAKRKFHQYAGSALIRLGYEKDDQWVFENVGQ